MKAHLVYGPWLPECLGCEKEIPLKRLTARPYSTYCVNCQARRDEKIIPFDSAIAICGESDDETRVVESGWNQTAHRTRTNHRIERFNIPA